MHVWRAQTYTCRNQHQRNPNVAADTAHSVIDSLPLTHSVLTHSVTPSHLERADTTHNTSQKDWPNFDWPKLGKPPNIKILPLSLLSLLCYPPSLPPPTLPTPTFSPFPPLHPIMVDGRSHQPWPNSEPSLETSRLRRWGLGLQTILHSSCECVGCPCVTHQSFHERTLVLANTLIMQSTTFAATHPTNQFHGRH